MPRKLNKNLVGALTLGGMVVLAAIGIIMLWKLSSQDPARYEQEAKKLADAGDYDRAWQTYYRAFQKGGQNNIEDLVKAAHCAIEDGKLPQALGMLDKALVRESQLPSALNESTRLNFELGNLYPGDLAMWRRVLESAQKLVKVDDSSVLGHHALGMAYLKLQDNDTTYEALGRQHLSRALELDPANADIAQDMVEQLWDAAARKQKGGPETAEVKALRETAESTLKSAIEKCEGQGPPEAISKLKELQCRLLIIEDKTEEGLDQLKRLAAGEQKKATAHLLLAQALAGGLTPNTKPDYAKAAETAEEGLKLDPRDMKLYFMLAEAYRQKHAEAYRQKHKEEELTEADWQELEQVYQRGLDAVPFRNHFRAGADNNFRIEFMTQLFMLDLQRAAQAKDDAAERTKALDSAERWITKLKGEVDEQSLVVRFLRAELFKAKGDFVAATTEAEAASRSGGAEAHFRLQVLLSELYMRQQQWGAAEKALTTALHLQPGSPLLWIWRGNVYLELGEPGKALVDLMPAQPGELRDYLIQNEMAIRLRIRADEALQRFDEAEKERQRLPEKSRQDPLAQARTALAAGKEEEVEQALRAGLEKDPENFELLSALVQYLVGAKRIPDAQAILTPRLNKDPQNAKLRSLAVLLEADDAARDAKIVDLIKEDPDDYSRAVRFARFYQFREKPEEQRKWLDAAEKARPDDSAVVEGQFLLALQTKDWSRAERYAARNAQLNLDGTEGKMASGRLALARAATLEADNHADQARAEVERAIGLFRSGLEKYPSFSLGWTYLADAQVKAGQFDGAKAALERALEIDPTNGLANRGMAMIARLQGNQKEEEQWLKRADKFMPNDPWVAQRSQILKEREDPKAGIARREKTRREEPQNTENLVLLARLYGDPKVADYDQACEIYRAALVATQNDIGLVREFAGFLARDEVNRPAEGEELLKSRISAAEGDSAKKAQLLVCLAQFYESQKQLATAERHFRMAVSVDPTVQVLIAAAEFCQRNNWLRDAMEYYERALKQMDDQPEAAKSARSRIIGLLLTQGDLDGAKEKIDDFAQRYPDDPQGLVFKGARERLDGDIRKAQEDFDAYLAKHPDNALVLWQRGQLYMLMGHWLSAIADLTSSKGKSPDGFGYAHRIALSHCLLEVGGRENEAIDELKSILDQHPDEGGVAEALADTYLRVRPPRNVDAETLIIGFMKKYPNEARWPMLLGRLGKQMRDWKKAAEGFEAAATIMRYQGGTLPALFGAYRAAGRARDLIGFAEDKVPAQVLNSQAEALVQLAWAYKEAGDSQKCSEAYDRALSAAKDFSMQNMVVSEMSTVFGKDVVLERYQDRVRSDPENIGNLEVYAHLQFMNNKLDEALQTCQRIRDLAVTNEHKIFANLAQGMLLDRMERFPEAKARYEEVLKIDPNQAMALNNLAYLLAERMNNAAEALPYARQAHRLNPNDPGVLDTLGWALSKNGQWGEAAGMLLRAIELDRQNAVAMYHLALVYKAREDVDEAKRFLTSAKQAAEAQGDKDLLSKIAEALKGIEGAGRQ